MQQAMRIVHAKSNVFGFFGLGGAEVSGRGIRRTGSAGDARDLAGWKAVGTATEVVSVLRRKGRQAACKVSVSKD